MSKIATELTRVSSSPEKQSGLLPTPICRGSTAIYPNLEAMRASSEDALKKNGPRYGRFGTPTTQAFDDALTELEGGFATVSVCSGLAASCVAIGAFVAQGDHILVSESVYGPVRRFCDSLTRFGIHVEYFDPMLGEELARKVLHNTKLVYLESPGSTTFEVQDVPAVVSVCRPRGIVTVIDNTWATPYFYNPLRMGVDVVVHSATKYICGHADSILGAIICDSEKIYSAIRVESIRLGQCVSAEDASLNLRGLRTLAVRLERHQQSALQLMDWLQEQSAVGQVLHPSRVDHPGHSVWRRDFRGGTGVFGLVLQEWVSELAADRFVESLSLFSIGHSWGGFESLIVPADLEHRARPSWLRPGVLLRLQIGLEDVADLQADLKRGFAELAGEM